MHKRVWTLIIGGAVLLSQVALAQAATPDGQKFFSIEKGRYLTNASDCAACHTDPSRPDRPFAGGRPIETPFGNLLAPNITPDMETGIGTLSDKQFDDAMRRGLRPDGSLLYPAMPYNHYAKMSEDDVMAIRAYLATLQPYSNKVVANQLPFPFNIRASMRVWNALFFTQGEFKPDPHQTAEWNRGAFLVEGPAHCGACHTAKNFLGGDNNSAALQGGNIQGWFAPDITNGAQSGLGIWSADQVVKYLKTGHNEMAAATGPMADEVSFSSSRMTDGDLKAIATYLKSLPGPDDHPKALPPTDPVMKQGEAIFHDTCSACHGLDGQGTPNLIPSLVKSSAVRAPDPTTEIRIIERGARSVATDAEPTAPGMPSFAWQLKDDQVAAVLTYIRNSWGAAAPPVTASDVRLAKEKFVGRPD